MLECRPPEDLYGATTEGGVNNQDWPEMEGPKVHLDPLRNSEGRGGGAMLLPGSRRQSWGGGDAARGSGGPKSYSKNPSIPAVELLIGATWGGGPECRDRYTRSMGDEVPVGGEVPGKEEAEYGTKPA